MYQQGNSGEFNFIWGLGKKRKYIIYAGGKNNP